MTPAHYHEEGHLHYLTFSCYNKLWLFKSSLLYSLFLEGLNSARVRWGFKLYGFVVMPNHVHLLIYPRADTTISSILIAVKRPFSYQALDHLRERQPTTYSQLTIVKGQREVRRFWQAGGGYDRNIFRDDTFVHTLEYMHLNPVRKKLVGTAEDWPWSSARFYQAKAADPIRVDWPEWW